MSGLDHCIAATLLTGDAHPDREHPYRDWAKQAQAELATLRARSEALQTIAEKHPDWWWNDETADCYGCGERVRGRSLYAEGRPDVWVDECTHAPDCWAAPIIALMGGEVKRG